MVEVLDFQGLYMKLDTVMAQVLPVGFAKQVVSVVPALVASEEKVLG